jgi:ubiquitin-conjugating enzyme E2 T
MSKLSNATKSRLLREYKRLREDPPPGISACLVNDDNLTAWRAHITGPAESPFANVVWQVDMEIPDRYPMAPPSARFVGERIPYHPNIDAEGRICLDTLKRKPTGSWTPAVNLATLLLSLQSLLGEPNPEDGLVADVSRLYRNNPKEWFKEAQRRATGSWTSARKQEPPAPANDEPAEKRRKV